MDPHYEQRLVDEVIYLHSLWHQGPPSRSLPYTNLQPITPTQFKKHKKTPKFKPRNPKKVGSFSGTEWPVKPLPEAPQLTQSGWPELKLKPNPQQTTRLLTPEELENHNWNQIQQRALKAAKEFYSRNSGSDDEESDEDDEDDDMDEEDGDVNEKEYDFFWKMFNEDEELKGYYVKHCGGGGEFSCLVCGGVNEKKHLKRLKKFKECVALVQHSTSIAKTKKIRSHRAYGRVICKVLGWDIDRLPSQIVTEHNPSELQIIDDGSLNLEVNPDEKAHDSETVDDESMVCEESLTLANVEEEEDTGKQALNDVETTTRGVVNNLEHVINNGARSSRNKKVEMNMNLLLEILCSAPDDKCGNSNLANDKFWLMCGKNDVVPIWAKPASKMNC
ncbi:uncharacterized protein LOC111893402 isoform X2 [Lactuca sativa]|uniref:uncharacterized protein LOC111893402 isoform X2 n=1 Tax=Lactuca sativa TaxID=4236 RepID=UPI001C687D1B|nr:uncharacterized protein LOC111893402 isoform X2 [Lactuca sativa]